jgi:hypothetical protein
VEHVTLLYVGGSFGFMSRSGNLGPQVVLCSIFWRTARLEWLYQLATPLIMKECSSFSTSSPASAVTWIFDLSHSDWCEVEYQGCFDLHFPDNYSFKKGNLQCICWNKSEGHLSRVFYKMTTVLFPSEKKTQNNTYTTSEYFLPLPLTILLISNSFTKLLSPLISYLLLKFI